MQIAYLLYERFTALDITGPHGVLDSEPSRLFWRSDLLRRMDRWENDRRIRVRSASGP